MKYITHVNIIITLTICLVGKSIISNPSIADAIIYIASCASLCFFKYISQKDNKEYKKITDEINQLKNLVNTNQLSKLKKQEPFKF